MTLGLVGPILEAGLFYELALTLEARERPAEAADALERALALPDREQRDHRNRADARERIRRLRQVITLRDRASRRAGSLSPRKRPRSSTPADHLQRPARDLTSRGAAPRSCRSAALMWLWLRLSRRGGTSP